MNQEKYLIEFKKVVDTMFEITKSKNADYSGEGAKDAFKNFRLIEQLGVATVEQGFIVRMTDKLSRISNLISQKNHVADEKITDTLLDLSTYSILMKLYLDSKSQPNETTK